MHDPLPEIVLALQKSRKYRYVCDATIQRIAEWSLKRYPKPKDAVKMAKNKLHQIYGAYMDHIDAVARAHQLESAQDDTALRDICIEIMKSHASTAERLPHLDRLYHDIFEIAGTPTSILDLACGLHPFAIPWMNLDRTTLYHAIDIDTRLTTLHNHLLHRLNMPQAAQCNDIFTVDLTTPFDLVFLLKTLPCLEQQETNATRTLLSRLNARWLVVSFPTQTLGGRNKGMAHHYAAQYEPVLQDQWKIVHELALPNEHIYLVKVDH